MYIEKNLKFDVGGSLTVPLESSIMKWTSRTPESMNSGLEELSRDSVIRNHGNVVINNLSIDITIGKTKEEAVTFKVWDNVNGVLPAMQEVKDLIVAIKLDEEKEKWKDLL